MKTALEFRLEHYGSNDARAYYEDEISLMEKFAEQFKIQEQPKDLQERRIKFFEKVGKQFLSKYDRQMLIDFCEYWTESNEGGKLMRYEMKKNQPFNPTRRLVTWHSNSKNNGFVAKKSKVHTNDDIMDAIKNQG